MKISFGAVAVIVSAPAIVALPDRCSEPRAPIVGDKEYFNRIASFPICSQIDLACDNDDETVAEIVAVSEDGKTLVYTDSEQDQLGFVSIIKPMIPVPLGTLALGGEPTSVAVCGRYALVGINLSEDFVNVSGAVGVVDISTQTIVATMDLPGQPDSVAVSPDCKYAAIAIENERDEDLGEGGLPQLPPGYVVVMDISSRRPSEWTTSVVDVTGLDGVFEPSDPEPEYVSINEDNIAVVSMQENNAMVLIDLETATVTGSFSAGEVDLFNVDETEEDVINQTETLLGVVREPDGVAWIGTDYFATADEGDWLGGSRGFTIFDTSGRVVFSSGNDLEHLTASIGHYPENRSGNKGNEPENAAYGIYGDDPLLFVVSERSSLVLVYDVTDPSAPVYKQALPAGVGPEGALPIPSRNLLAVASEVDDRGDKIRSVINIYKRGFVKPVYPTLMSVDRSNGSPIPFSALSGLAACMKCEGNTLFAVEDSFYGTKRILTIKPSLSQTSEVVSELFVMDSKDMLATTILSFGLDTEIFVNADKTVNMDLEGIATSKMGGFWVVAEGNDITRGDFPNMLAYISKEGVIEDVVTLPQEIIDTKIRFGFEGVAETGDEVVIAFQRAWTGFDEPLIGKYNYVRKTWDFVFYPLDAPESQNGGWVGLSDIVSVGDGYFLVLERDNQGGPDAAIKKLYIFTFSETIDSMPYPTLKKYLAKDLLAVLATATNGPVAEKVEGLAVDKNGRIWIVNDNDGVDDNSGETLFIEIGELTLNVGPGTCEVCVECDCLPCA